MPPLNEAQRLERLRKRQREWEEAWRQACERQEKAGMKKNPRNAFPRIIVTDYEFVFACDEYVNTNDRSSDMYFEESYQVICRPVQCISDENLRRQPLPKLMQEFQEPMPKVCDPYTGLDPTDNVTTSFNPSERATEIFVPYGNFETNETMDSEAYPILDHTDKIPGELPPIKRVDSPRGENAGIKECDESASENNITEDPLLVTSYTSSGSSLETVIAEIHLIEEIKQADNTGTVVHMLYIAHRYQLL